MNDIMRHDNKYASHIDYYQILAVNPNATGDEIEAAYRYLAPRLHPKANPNPYAKQACLELDEAYRVLIDPVERGNYDLARQDRCERRLQGKSRLWHSRFSDEIIEMVNAGKSLDEMKMRLWWTGSPCSDEEIAQFVEEVEETREFIRRLPEVRPHVCRAFFWRMIYGALVFGACLLLLLGFYFAGRMPLGRFGYALYAATVASLGWTCSGLIGWLRYMR